MSRDFSHQKPKAIELADYKELKENIGVLLNEGHSHAGHSECLLHNMYKKTMFSIHVAADMYIKSLFPIYDEVVYAL